MQKEIIIVSTLCAYLGWAWTTPTWVCLHYCFHHYVMFIWTSTALCGFEETCRRLYPWTAWCSSLNTCSITHTYIYIYTLGGCSTGRAWARLLRSYQNFQVGLSFLGQLSGKTFMPLCTVNLASLCWDDSSFTQSCLCWRKACLWFALRAALVALSLSLRLLDRTFFAQLGESMHRTGHVSPHKSFSCGCNKYIAQSIQCYIGGARVNANDDVRTIYGLRTYNLSMRVSLRLAPTRELGVILALLTFTLVLWC